MPRIFLRKSFVLLLALSCPMWSCKDDGPDDPPEPTFHNCFLEDSQIIIADIAGIPSGVIFDKIKADISGAGWQIIGTVEAQYTGGDITLSLPPVFDAQELMKAGREDYKDYAGFWPAEQVDNPAAKVAGLRDFLAYNGDEKVGRIYLSDWTGEGSKVGKMFVYYHYAEEPFTLGGFNLRRSGQEISFQYEASFAGGWNFYVNIGGDISLCKTTVDGETPLGWLFESHVY